VWWLADCLPDSTHWPYRVTCRQGHRAPRASPEYKYKEQPCHSSHQPRWWIQRKSMKRWTVTPNLHGRSTDKTSLHSVTVKASKLKCEIPKWWGLEISCLISEEKPINCKYMQVWSTQVCHNSVMFVQVLKQNECVTNSAVSSCESVESQGSCSWWSLVLTSSDVLSCWCGVSLEVYKVQCY
jgi:hypothetical protein